MFLGASNTLLYNYPAHLVLRMCSIQPVVIVSYVIISNVGTEWVSPKTMKISGHFFWVAGFLQIEKKTTKVSLMCLGLQAKGKFGLQFLQRIHLFRLLIWFPIHLKYCISLQKKDLALQETKMLHEYFIEQTFLKQPILRSRFVDCTLGAFSKTLKFSNMLYVVTVAVLLFNLLLCCCKQLCCVRRLSQPIHTFPSEEMHQRGHFIIRTKLCLQNIYHGAGLQCHSQSYKPYFFPIFFCYCSL